jgi:hypothetical protein
MFMIMRSRLASVVVAVFSLSVFAQAQQAPPKADTYVTSSTPNVNYGSSPILIVGSGTTAYMKFNLSGVPAGPSVSKATLRLFVDAVASGGQFDVYDLAYTLHGRRAHSRLALTQRSPMRSEVCGWRPMSCFRIPRNSLTTVAFSSRKIE